MSQTQAHLSAIIILALVGLASAAVFFEYQKPQPGKEPFCVDKVEGKKKAGDVWTVPNLCLQKRCLTDSQGTPLISGYTCGAVAVPEDAKCRLVEDKNRPYPDCCPKIVCDD